MLRQNRALGRAASMHTMCSRVQHFRTPAGQQQRQWADRQAPAYPYRWWQRCQLSRSGTQRLARVQSSRVGGKPGCRRAQRYAEQQRRSTINLPRQRRCLRCRQPSSGVTTHLATSRQQKQQRGLAEHQRHLPYRAGLQHHHHNLAHVALHWQRIGQEVHQPRPIMPWRECRDDLHPSSRGQGLHWETPHRARGKLELEERSSFRTRALWPCQDSTQDNLAMGTVREMGIAMQPQGLSGSYSLRDLREHSTLPSQMRKLPELVSQRMHDEAFRGNGRQPDWCRCRLRQPRLQGKGEPAGTSRNSPATAPHLAAEAARKRLRRAPHLASRYSATSSENVRRRQREQSRSQRQQQQPQRGRGPETQEHNHYNEPVVSP